jgi:uncharacterized protein YydD (DUF2326 family)
MKTSKREIEEAKSELIKAAERDHEERRSVWSNAVRYFNQNSEALYKRPGSLVIDVGDKGFTYEVKIERSGSEGIEKMKIFCFDLANLRVQRENGRGIDFLIHDTLMYDAVDARQRAKALELAATETEHLETQYICTINSDMVPTDDFSPEFEFESYVRATLTDSTPSGKLLGIDFER